MLAVTGKSVSALFQEITDECGELFYRETDFSMTPARRVELEKVLFVDRCEPALEGLVHVSREDGVKLYFADGSWVICRFSGTEPLLRMAAEADTPERAERYIRAWRELLKL